MSWLLAIRPKTLTAIIAPVMMAGALARPFSIPMWSLSLLFGLLIQIGTNLANDYFDHRKGKRYRKAQRARARLPGRAYLSRGCAHSSDSLFFAAPFSSASSSVTLSVSMLSISVPLASLLASPTPRGPYALAYIGLGDLFVLIFFGPIALGATHTFVTGTFAPAVYALGFAPGLLSTGSSHCE